MFLFPSAAAVVAFVFAWLLLRRYARRRRPAELAWAIALLMYAVASAALALGQIDGWSNREYEVYWTLGAILNVPFLAMGEVFLLNPKRRMVGDALEDAHDPRREDGGLVAVVEVEDAGHLSPHAQRDRDGRIDLQRPARRLSHRGEPHAYLQPRRDEPASHGHSLRRHGYRAG